MAIRAPAGANKLAASSQPFRQVYGWSNLNGLDSHQWHSVAQLSKSCHKPVAKLTSSYCQTVAKLSSSYRVFFRYSSPSWSHTVCIWRSDKSHTNSEKSVQYWRVQKVSFLSSLPEIRCPCALLLLTPLTSMLGGEEEANFATNLKPRDLRSCPQDPPEIGDGWASQFGLFPRGINAPWMSLTRWKSLESAGNWWH